MWWTRGSDTQRERQVSSQNSAGPWCLPDKATLLVIRRNALQAEGLLCRGRTLCQQVRARASTSRSTPRWIRKKEGQFSENAQPK